MIITTTGNIDGKRILEYRGIVFGEVVAGVDFIRDIKAGFSNIFGGRSKSYEDELIQARENALFEMSQRAQERGCNAVIGSKLDYETLGTGGNMLMVIASGTAVITD